MNPVVGLVFFVLGSLLVGTGRAGARHVSDLAGSSPVEELRLHRERVVRRGARACVAVGAAFVVFAVLQWALAPPH